MSSVVMLILGNNYPIATLIRTSLSSSKQLPLRARGTMSSHDDPYSRRHSQSFPSSTSALCALFPFLLLSLFLCNHGVEALCECIACHMRKLKEPQQRLLGD